MLLTSPTVFSLWHELVKFAENKRAVTLEHNIEHYLVSMLAHYADKPEMSKQVLAIRFLETQQQAETKATSLRHLGDHCLLYAGLFPRITERRLVTIGYFVTLGQHAYLGLSNKTDDLFAQLAMHFVVLMDVLQSIRQTPDLLPLHAYEQWQETGSQHAFQLLQAYASGLPLKR